MADKHWAKGKYVLAWRDLRSNGRMRMSWSDDPTKLVEMAQGMAPENEAALYEVGKRLPLRGGPSVSKVEPQPKPRAKRKPKPDGDPVAA